MIYRCFKPDQGHTLEDATPIEASDPEWAAHEYAEARHADDEYPEEDAVVVVDEEDAYTFVIVSVEMVPSFHTAEARGDERERIRRMVDRPAPEPMPVPKPTQAEDAMRDRNALHRLTLASLIARADAGVAPVRVASVLASMDVLDRMRNDLAAARGEPAIPPRPCACTSDGATTRCPVHNIAARLTCDFSDLLDGPHGGRDDG